jgi:[FeFe] hydrogenase H-cluster maturation GTPase HydF
MMEKGKDAKPHIGLYGRRNNGKSSLINVLVGQDFAIVSDVAGTTTDPVRKSVEIPGIGPVVLVDTAGIDDEGELGKLRIAKTLQTIATVDMAILVVTHNVFGEPERRLIAEFDAATVPYIVVHNKSDLEALEPGYGAETGVMAVRNIVAFSSKQPDRDMLVTFIKATIPSSAYQKRSLLGDLVSGGDIVMLVTPVDIEAPEGRMILPQVQVIRDALDNDCVAVVVKEREVDAFLKKTALKPALVVSDTQVILKADASVPPGIPLTGFSILLAYHKGDFSNYLRGTPRVSELKDGDRVLLLESCTHHVSCDDIGRVKIPRWMTNFTGKKLEFDVVSGLDVLPRPITDYGLVVQCGGCMITRKQLISRLKPAVDAGIPVTNYGMIIAYVQGVYDRCIRPFMKNMTPGGETL